MKTIIRNFILVSLIALGSAAPQVVFAEQALNSATVTNDAVRFAKYLSTIKGYLQETRTLLSSLNDGGKEYIAGILLSNYGGIGDYMQMENNQVSSAYAKFKSEIDSCQEYFKSTCLSPDQNGYSLKDKATGSLAYDDNDFSEVFRYQKMAASPYPKVSQNNTYMRQAGQAEANAYALGLSTRNTDAISALLRYLAAVQVDVTAVLLNRPADAQARQEVFAYAKQAAKFAYEITKRIPAFKVTLANNRYLLHGLLYTRIAGYKNASLNSYIQAYARITTSTAHYTWSEFKRSNPVVIDWSSYDYDEEIDTHTWLLITKKWENSVFRSKKEDSLPGAINGRYPVEKMKSQNESSWDRQEAMHNPPVPAAVRAAITGAYAGDYASSNRVYNECLSLRDACVKALNDFLTTYAQKGLPSAQFFSADPAIHNEGVDPDNLTTDFYDLSLNINSYLAKINNPPIARLAEVPAQKLSYTFKLNNAFCSDPDKDKLSSRWVITAIPDTAEAKSQTYVVYQKLSATDIAVLTPDLAGDWQVTLDINDAQDGNEAVATMNAIRRILWVQHNDKDTYLSNYAYTSEELSCEFNQEIAPEKAGVYLNYDDLGKPVDQIEYTLPQNTQYCFTLEKVRGEYDHSKGKYDGLMGSTPLQSDAFRYHPDVGAFNLASSASSDEFAILKVEAVDSSITDLVLSTKQSLYGFKVSYPNKRIGTYQIKQWVDNYAWINMDGKGFVKYDRKASGACHPCPDWLEERAARVLNESEPYLRQYVQRILPSATEGEFGHFDPKNPRNIYLDDYNVRMRYNLPVASEYGWFVVMALDGNARHEAHHIWYYNEMIRKGLKDADQDWLPADSAGGKIVYLQDSASNFCGAKLTGIFNPVEPGIVYLGDNQSDAVEEALAPGSKKEFLSYYSVADSNGEFVKEIENVVPQALPMKRYAEIKIKEIWIPMTDSSTVFLKEGVDYTYTVYPIAGDRQGILVNLNTAVVVGKIHSNNMGKYVIEYNVIMSVPPGENDACRIMPGTFVGGA